MATYTITKVYVVKGDGPLDALQRLAAWRENEEDRKDISVTFQSVQLSELDEPVPIGPNPWLAEAKRQLLGREPQQLARSKRQS